MSIKAMTWAWDQDVPPAAKLVLLALGDHADDRGGNSYPSVELIGRKTGYSTRQVQRILSELIRLDAIDIQQPPRATQPRRPTTYALNLLATQSIARGDWSARGATSLLRLELIERDEQTCGHCGRWGDEEYGPDGFTWEADRVKPGDTYSLDTCVLSCRTCNRKKGGRFGSEDKMSPQPRRVRMTPHQHERGDTDTERGDTNEGFEATLVSSEPKEEPTKEPKRASHAERDDEGPRQATPVSPRRTPRQRPSGRRLAAAEENGPGDSRLIGVSTNTARASAERTRQQVVHQPTSAAGLAAEFDRRAREAGLHGPQQLNPGALSRNLRRWMDEGDTALAIQNMFDKFYDNATVHPADTPLWTHFIRVGPKLRAGTKDTSIDYAAAAERDRERLKRDAAAGDQRAIAVLDGSAYKWRQQS